MVSCTRVSCGAGGSYASSWITPASLVKEDWQLTALPAPGSPMPRTADTDPHEGWTDRAKQVADVAWRLARARGHDHIRAEHYLTALLDAGRGAGNLPSVALLVLESLNVPVDELRQRIDDALGDSGWPHQHGVPTTPEVWPALKVARVECDLMGHQYIGTEHLLLGIAVEGTSLAAQVLNELGATPGRLREGIHRVLTMHAHGRRSELEDTTHHVTLPAEIRDLDEMIAELRRRKEHAIDVGDNQARGPFGPRRRRPWLGARPRSGPGLRRSTLPGS